MRSPLLLFAVTSLAGSALAAQQPSKPDPLIAAGGLTRSGQFSGLQLGAEYSLRRDRWLGFRVEAAGYWQPTQKFSYSYTIGDLASYQGSAGAAGFQLGLSAIASPLPRGRISPYVVAGATRFQSWHSEQGEYLHPDGSRAVLVPSNSSYRANLQLVRGIGLRLRLGDRPFDLEYRSYGGHSSAYTLGTSLRF
jgi:opacity protein-like surface antigen